jgi:hypothetical protein
VEVKDGKGVAVPVTTYTTGIVDGVKFRDGMIMLSMGSIEVSLDQVLEIAASTPTAGPAPHVTTGPGILRSLART